MAISASQKGRIIEQLVGTTLMLQSNGDLRVSLPIVDDEGVDLVVGNRLNDKTLLLQIKGRFSLSGRNRYIANVRRVVCKPNPNMFLLFVYYAKTAARLHDVCWLVPTLEFCQLLGKTNPARPVYVFDSSFEAKKDMWAPFHVSLKDLAAEILKALK
jgi:hypothetical protein